MPKEGFFFFLLTDLTEAILVLLKNNLVNWNLWGNMMEKMDINCKLIMKYKILKVIFAFQACLFGGEALEAFQNGSL